METIGVALSTGQKAKLRNGHKVILKPGDHMIQVSAAKAARIRKAFSNNKGASLSLDVDEGEPNREILGGRISLGKLGIAKPPAPGRKGVMPVRDLRKDKGGDTPMETISLHDIMRGQGLPADSIDSDLEGGKIGGLKKLKKIYRKHARKTVTGLVKQALPTVSQHVADTAASTLESAGVPAPIAKMAAKEVTKAVQKEAMNELADQGVVDGGKIGGLRKFKKIYRKHVRPVVTSGLKAALPGLTAAAAASLTSALVSAGVPPPLAAPIAQAGADAASSVSRDILNETGVTQGFGAFSHEGHIRRTPIRYGGSLVPRAPSFYNKPSAAPPAHAGPQVTAESYLDHKEHVTMKSDSRAQQSTMPGLSIYSPHIAPVSQSRSSIPPQMRSNNFSTMFSNPAPGTTAGSGLYLSAPTGGSGLYLSAPTAGRGLYPGGGNGSGLGRGLYRAGDRPRGRGLYM